MRILLTGAAGFIGSHLSRRLLSEGAEVVGVDNLCTGRARNIASLTDHPGFRFIEHDVTQVIDPGGPLDWVMHFASPASPPKYLARPTETLRVNGEGTYQLLELAVRKHAQFFLASTSEVYGDPLVHPQVESYWGNVNPNGPRSVYDEAKRYAEALTMSYARTAKLPVRVIRIFNTFGPNMDPNDGRVVTNFITQALEGAPMTLYGDGQQTRSLQYVDDLVEGIVRLMRVNWQTPVNLGNPDEHTVADIASLIRTLTGSSSSVRCEPLPTDDPRRRKPDISVAKEVLGWEPRVHLRDGLERTIAHFRAELAEQACA